MVRPMPHSAFDELPDRAGPPLQLDPGRRRWLRLALGLGLAALCTAALPACTDDGAFSGPRIFRVVPPEAPPGAVVKLEGEGFGDLGTVALGGRALQPDSWSPGTVRLRLPADVPAGASLLVVVSGGRASPPQPFDVLGGGFRVDYGRRFPDAGPRPDGDIINQPPDAGPGPIDQGIDAGEGTVVAVFSPDPAGDDAVRLEAVGGDPPGFLTLRVMLPRLGSGSISGVALHLAYDAGVMQFDRVIEPATGTRLVVKALASNRLALGAVGPAEQVAVLRFRLGARGEARIDLPTRHRSLRDANNQVIAARYAGGSVRLVTR